MECYNFCQQYKDHFVIVGATSQNQVSFIAIFLKDWTLYHWQQHKQKAKSIIIRSIIQKEFKAFLWYNLREFGILSGIKSKELINTN